MYNARSCRAEGDEFLCVGGSGVDNARHYAGIAIQHSHLTFTQITVLTFTECFDFAFGGNLQS